MGSTSFENFVSAVTKIAARVGLELINHAPEIMAVVGTGCVIAAGVTTAKAALNMETLEAEKNGMLEKAAKFKKETPEYTEEKYEQDVAIIYGRHVVKVIKNFALPVTLGVVGIGLFVGGQHVLSKRLAKAYLAYKTLNDGFNAYQKVVEASVGSEKALGFREAAMLGTNAVQLLASGNKEETNFTTELKETHRSGNEYAKYFTSASPMYRNDYETNLAYLYQVERFLNQKLNACGHMFLNEVYDELGIKRTEVGALCGWVKGGEGDDFIDFRIKPDQKAVNANAVNGDIAGYECPPILLDFNVQGIIFDLI